MIIDIFQNNCKVSGDKSELYAVRDYLTIDVPGAKYTKLFQRRQWDGKKRFFNLLSKTFPIGLLSYIPKENISYRENRNFLGLDNSLPKLNIELRDYQKEAIIQCVENKNGIVHAATNAGKTIIFSGLVKKFYPHNTLILIHRDEILTQTKKAIQEVTGLDVGIITSKEKYIRPVTIAMVTTLLNRIGQDEEITNFFDTCKCVIADECHHTVSATYQSILSACKAVYRYGFSGTVFEKHTHPGMLVRSWLGDVLFEITNDELISMGVSAKPLIRLYEIDSSQILKGVFNEAKQKLIGTKYDGKQLMREVYNLVINKGVVENEERNSKVLEIINNSKNKSVLIVVDYLRHGQSLEESLLCSEIKCSFISGDSEKRESALNSFKDGSLKILISTNIIDEGVDISRIEVLIMLAGKKSKRQLLQRVGRSLRKKLDTNTVIIYDFMDYGNRYLEKHSKERLKIYKDEGFDIEFI